ncbi:transposase [Flammeovirgaceae bacterium SG7u.111]|nr:transposase [Flammeovirgaceae bacterium SG7u.132]WPO37859.1 transposase [Flammeovirgaceae bacterium SG7u.111]
MNFLSQFSDLLPVLPPFELVLAERDEPSNTVHLYLEVPPEATPKKCSIHSYYDRTWEHLKLFQYRCFIHCKLPIYKDRDTGKLSKAEVSFSRDYSRFTLMFGQEVMRLMHIHHCFTAVARTLGIRVQRVEHIYHHYTQHLEDDYYSQHTASRIAYDETSTRKGHEYITSFFDLDTWQLPGSYEGRSSECVARFKQDHPYPEAVEEISIDMSPAFIKGAKQCFPQAKVTFDKWHVIKLLYKHLDRLGEKAYCFQAQIELSMERIGAFYRQDQFQELKAQLCFIMDLAQETMETNPITKSIKSHFDGIVQYAQSKINNGILEGLNSKIQIIKRVARGFRSKDNFIKMIYFVFAKYQFQVNS